MSLPDRPGWWRNLDSDELIEIYLLDPVGILCFWGPDVGITYSGSADKTVIWSDDEWVGHIPAHRYDGNPENWEFVRELS